MVFLTSLQSIVPIVLLISLGYILKGRGMFNPSFSGNLSRFIMSVILPAGVFVSPLSLIYIGIVLHDAGLKSMKLNKDALGGIVGRFVVSRLIMFGVMYRSVCYRYTGYYGNTDYDRHSSMIENVYL
ncbi:hypothetical protein [Veillonella denticariosi]|uniref:hypothetical protein n=1 Tax=Veillonella denticariosi TaxID=419208 RepID=UPI001FE46EA9|nr:hypothetical protein [Veillonella denticariosi]